MSTFNHSVKVPKLYKCASKICQEVARGEGSIKQLVYEKKHFNTKALYALIVTTFQKAQEIDLVLKRTKLLDKEPRFDPWLAKILISELLWGKKKLPSHDAKPIQTILAYEQSFKAHLSDTSVEDSKGNVGNRKPRYVRINTLYNSVNEAIELLQDEGWILQTSQTENTYDAFLEQVNQLEGDMFLRDIHLPDLLIFPSGTEFYNHAGYKKGALILQDKASCLPVHILSPPAGSTVLDMCAAPGMKTTQIASMLNDNGTIYAVERDTKRFYVLNEMVEKAGATCIKTINKDVLECNESDFPGVEYILVDPSCSGSGINGRIEVLRNEHNSRLQKLAGFQIKILRTALSRYPRAKRVVYSTCSIYPEENEEVVRQVLETNNEFKLVPAENFVNKLWKNFGSSDFGDIGRYCLYARPEDDLTNGFFVAVFERLEEGQYNRFFNGRVSQYMKNHNRNEKRKIKKELEHMQADNDQSKVTQENDLSNNDNIKSNDTVITKKSKKKRKHENHDEETVNESSIELKKKKNKDKKTADILGSNNYIEKETKEKSIEILLQNDIGSKKSKRKKRKGQELQNVNIEQIISSNLSEQEVDFDQTVLKKPKKKKKKEHSDSDCTKAVANNESIPNVNSNADVALSKKDKKKKKNKKEIDNPQEFTGSGTMNEANSSAMDIFVEKHEYAEERINSAAKKKKNKHSTQLNI